MIIEKMIDYIIKALTQCSYIETNKYKIRLQNKRADTYNGKVYQIAIATEYKGYEEGVDK